MQIDSISWGVQVASPGWMFFPLRCASMGNFGDFSEPGFGCLTSQIGVNDALEVQLHHGRDPWEETVLVSPILRLHAVDPMALWVVVKVEMVAKYLNIGLPI